MPSFLWTRATPLNQMSDSSHVTKPTLRLLFFPGHALFSISGPLFFTFPTARFAARQLKWSQRSSVDIFRTLAKTTMYIVLA
jgi:hypothetical protein